MALYDRIGRSYTATRSEDPRIRAAIHAALGDARTVLNVGAGTGNYEPRDREVTAVEPSATMIAQRPPEATKNVIQAGAEQLPFEDQSFDVAMGVLTDHHWPDRAGGLREMRRVGRRRVLFTWDPARTTDSWLVQDYLPEFLEEVREGMPIEEIAEHVGATRIEPVPIPHDCRDGFLHAFWRRPEAYLDPVVRAGISVFSLIEVGDGLERLARDVESGAWRQKHGDVLELDEMDLGYRLLIG